MALKPNTVAAVALIDEKIAQLNEKRAALMEQIRAEAPKGSTVVEYKDVKYVVKATPREALDTTAFQKDHPYTEFPQFYKTTPQFSAALVKGDAREGYIVPGTTSISIEKAN